MEKVIADLRFQEIHIYPEIIFHRRNIPPVLLQLIPEYTLDIFMADQNVPYEIIAVFLRTLLYHFNQKTSSDYINTAGNGIGFGHNRFFLKFLNPVFFVHLNGSVTFHIHTGIHLFAYHRNVSLLVNVIFKNLVQIQLIYTITGSNDNIRFMAAFQEGKVLINRICRSPVPVTVLSGNGGREYKQTALLSTKIPPFGRA